MNRLTLFCSLVGFGLTCSAATVEFNRDVRPILSENCFACHGFDAKQRQAELRLDTAEGALADREGKFAIKPGDLAASEVWKRVSSTDPDVMMPPPASRKQLTAELRTRRSMRHAGRQSDRGQGRGKIVDAIKATNQASALLAEGESE